MEIMPMYTYYCMACDQDFEKLIKMEMRDQAMCESCGNRLIRGLDRPGLVWAPTSSKGTGFRT